MSDSIGIFPAYNHLSTMISAECLAERVDHVYPLVVKQFAALGKNALGACQYNTDFIKKTSWQNGNTFVAKGPGQENRQYTGLIIGEVVGGGDGTQISALGNFWPGRVDDDDYVCLFLSNTL